MTAARRRLALAAAAAAAACAAATRALPPMGGGGGVGRVMTWYGDDDARAPHLPLRADCGDRLGAGPLNSSRAPLSLVVDGREAWAPAAFFELPGGALLVAGLRPHTQPTGRMLPDVLRSDDGGRSWSCVGADYSWGAARAGAVAFSVARRLPPAAGQSDGAAVVAAACVAGGRPLRFEGAAPTAATRDRKRAHYSPGAAGGVFDAPVRDVRCTADGAVWRAAAPLPSAVVGATHVRIVPVPPAADGSSGGGGGGGGAAPPPTSFDVLLGGWREDGGQDLWVAEYPPDWALNASDPLAAVLPSGWRVVRLPKSALTCTSTVATWLAATQLLLLGGGELPVDSLAGPDPRSGAQDGLLLADRRLAVDASAAAQGGFARPLSEAEADLTTGTTRDVIPQFNLMVVEGLLPLLLAPWQPAEQQPPPAANLTRLSLLLPEARTASAPRAYALSSGVVTEEGISAATVVRSDLVVFHGGSDVYATFFDSELEWPAARGFMEWRHTRPMWPQTRAPEVVAPANMLGAANWDRHGLLTGGDEFDYVLGASAADGGLLRGSTVRCELNTSCEVGQQYSTGCRETPWDAQCTPCTRCVLGETYASTVCVLRGDAECTACPACKPGFAIAIACGMPGNPSKALHVCELVGAVGRQPLLSARELAVVGAVLGAEAVVVVLAVAALAATAAWVAPTATADPLAAAACAARRSTSSAVSVLTTAAVVTITLALVGASLVARAPSDGFAIAITSLVALCVGPVAVSALLALPDAWLCAAFGCEPGLQLPATVAALLWRRPLESALLLLALPWRPQLLLSLAPLEPASGAPGGPRDAEWGSKHAAAAAGPPSASGAASSSAASVAAPAWSPQQGVVLRTLTLGVALVGDLPLVLTSIAWVLVSRSSDGGGLRAYVALPALSFVLCLWHLCSALMAAVESAARGPSQAAAARLFGEAATAARTTGDTAVPAAGRVGRASQRDRRLDAAGPSDDSFVAVAKRERRRRPAPSVGKSGAADGLGASSGLPEAAAVPASPRSPPGGVAAAAVVVGNPLQQQPPPPQPPSAGWQPQHGDAHASKAVAAVVSSSSSRGVVCPLIQAAVESLCRELGVPLPSSSGSIGFESLQRIGELWARAATPEARRLADMSTFWSTHPALLPAALDGVLQSPLPPAWLRLLHALEGAAQQQRRRRRDSDSDGDSCRDDDTATPSDWTPPSSSSHSSVDAFQPVGGR